MLITLLKRAESGLDLLDLVESQPYCLMDRLYVDPFRERAADQGWLPDRERTEMSKKKDKKKDKKKKKGKKGKKK